MPSLRIIPCVLGKSATAVKGQQFDNWRVVGTAQATSLVQARREADEFVFLDVEAGLRGTHVSPNLANALAKGLRIPFCVGGGISTVEEASQLFSSGADKILIGTAARSEPVLIDRLAEHFGSQSIVCSVDTLSPLRLIDRLELSVNGREVGVGEMVKRLQDRGVGEILLTNVERDGTMQGLNVEALEEVVRVAEVPIVAGSGVAGTDCFRRAFDAGASGVFAGALFQFTPHTPETIRSELRELGYEVRQKIT